jgi:hypothetical protein
LVKLNLDYVISAAKHFNRLDFKDNSYLNKPLIEKENYVWFHCPLEFYAGSVQEDYYDRYINIGDHKQVSRKELYKLIKSYQTRGNQ